MRRLAGLSVAAPITVPEVPISNTDNSIPDEADEPAVAEPDIPKVQEHQKTRDDRNASIKCTLCSMSIFQKEWSQHLYDPGHARRARILTYHQALQAGVHNDTGINIVTGDLDFGIVELDSLAEWPIREDSFYVQVDEPGYRITRIRMTSRHGRFADFRDLSFQVRFTNPVPLQPGITYSLKVTFDPKGNRGRHEDQVEFTFDSPSKGLEFTLIRGVKAIVAVSAHHEQLAPLGPYVRPPRRAREYKSFIADGIKPSNFERQKTAFRVPFPEFQIPPELSKIFGRGSAEQQIQTVANMFPSGLGHATYPEFWRVLLWLEEYQAQKDMENYDQTDVQFSVKLRRNYLDNPPQLQAVTAIARLPPGGIPFIIFGPPGTGKTVTLVEAILQVLHRFDSSRILVCAPSNNAADIITDRLRMHLHPTHLFRLNAPSRAKELPRVPDNHFTHILVDEAGQASEPEVMIPIKLTAGPRTTVVLAGDPKQLGPVIRSSVAKHLGLERSYLERLMSMPMYEVKANRGATFVKLVKNWRSNLAIIDFPNWKFYEGELEECAPPSVSQLFIGWRGLPNPEFPVIFHAIKGRDLREVSSPSWFNIEEASAVWYYVRDIRCDPSLSLEDEHIGVIAPYQAQVRKIRTILGVDFPEVKVGTAEEFQGDERHAIIVSSVRSSLDFVEFRSPSYVGVPMTRAKSILVVIGDPDVLGLDPLWRQFLNYIYENGGWRGVRIPWDPAQDVVTDSSANEDLPYDAEMRAKSEQDLRDLVTRASTTGLGTLDEADGLEADADKHWYQDES
ncbi:hypothetical protein FRB90_001909 [Tulasnella sp. 427]|nr:hypothetical protein FRB90_001909 [Tulasnella sp. 427]